VDNATLIISQFGVQAGKLDLINNLLLEEADNYTISREVMDGSKSKIRHLNLTSTRLPVDISKDITTLHPEVNKVHRRRGNNNMVIHLYQVMAQNYKGYMVSRDQVATGVSKTEVTR